MDNKSLSSQRRYQRIPITVANGVLSGSNNEANITLDPAFNKIIAVAFHETGAGSGGLSGNYRVGFRTDNYVWVDPITSFNWNTATGVPIDGKFRWFKDPNNPDDKGGIGYGTNMKAYVTVIPGANLSADLVGELVLILQRDLTQVPSQ